MNLKTKLPNDCHLRVQNETKETERTKVKLKINLRDQNYNLS